MSSVAGFIFEKEVPLSNLARSLGAMSRQHPHVHIGKYGTGVGFIFECSDVQILQKLNEQKPSSIGESSICMVQLGGKTFIEIRFDLPIGTSIEQVFQEWGLSDIHSRIAFAEQTQSSYDGKTIDHPAMVTLDELAVAACGYISWVIQNTDTGKKMTELARFRGFDSDTDYGASPYALWIQQEYIKDNGNRRVLEEIPTIQASLILDGRDTTELKLVAIRRDTRNDGIIRPEDRTPYLYYAMGQEGCAMASTTEGVGALVDRFTGPMELRAIDDMEAVSFCERGGLSSARASYRERI